MIQLRVFFSSRPLKRPFEESTPPQEQKFDGRGGGSQFRVPPWHLAQAYFRYQYGHDVSKFDTELHIESDRLVQSEQEH